MTDREHLKLTEPFEEAPESIDDIGSGKPLSDELKIARSQYKEAYSFWEKIYKIARRDKNFLQTVQWDEKVVETRAKAGKASVTAPLIGAYYRQQMGRLLPGAVDISFISVDGADASLGNRQKEESAQILRGVSNFIDRQSNVWTHRKRARTDQASGGIGWLGLSFVPSEGVSDGDLKEFSPKDSESILIDPYAEEPDYSDARYCFHKVRMTWKEAKAKYGRKLTKLEKENGESIYCDELREMRGYLEGISTIDSNMLSQWLFEESKEILLADWYWRRPADKTYYSNETGQEFDEDAWKAYQDEIEEQQGFRPTPVETRKETGWKVERRVITAWSVLEEEEDFFINEVPFCPVLGYTINNGSNVSYHGVAHDGIEIQEHINYLTSTAVTKASKPHTAAFMPHGVMADSLRKLTTIGNVEVYGFDPIADGVLPNGGGIQLVNSPDNGSLELQQLPIYIEMLRQLTNLDNNDAQASGQINSAVQLQINLEQKESIIIELDQNYVMALECMTRKRLKAIQAVYTAEEMVPIVDIDAESPEISRVSFPADISVSKYETEVRLMPSTTTQRRNKELVLQGMVNTNDPAAKAVAIPELIRNADIGNSKRMLLAYARAQALAGNFLAVPPDLRDEVMAELQETGEFTRVINTLATNQAQQMVAQMVQTGQVQAEISKNQATTAKAQSTVQKAAIDASRAVAQDQQQAIQQAHQTEQERLRVMQEVINLQQDILDLQMKGMEIEETKMRALEEALARASIIGINITGGVPNVGIPNQSIQ